MIKRYFLLFFSLITGWLAGQSPATLTLDEALRIARENRLELKAQAVQVQLAGAANDQVRAQWRPQISGAADLRWNTQLQSNVLPIGTFGLPGVPSDATRTVQFGAPFNNSLSLQVEQKLLDANRAVDKKINTNEVENQRNRLEQLRVEVRYAVTQAYYNALWQQERVRLAEQALDRAQVSLNEGQQRFRDGALLKNDLDRLALDVNNARLTLNRIRQDQALSLENLKYQLLLPAETPIKLADSLEQLRQANTALPPSRLETRPEIRAEEIAAAANDLLGEKQRRRNRPGLSAYGNYTLLQLHDKFNPFASDTWFPFNYVGIRLTLPIYDGKQARLAARDYAWRRQINQINREKRLADFNYETQQYQTALSQAESEWQEARANIDLAKQVWETDQLRLRQGVLLPKDLKDSEYARQQAENNYLSAVYNWLVASLNWQKASGNLGGQ